MTAEKLKYGDKIGIISPSHVGEKANYAKNFRGLQSLGFNIVEGQNLYKDTYGYSASEKERADDFNDMVANNEIKMIFFGGGIGSNEIIPLLNYDEIKINKKIICSYSDGTTILNVIYAKTNLTVYYGQTPGIFGDLRYYDYTHFISNFVDKEIKIFKKNSEWKVLNHGICEGKLIGGFTENMAFLVGNKYFSYDKSRKYILFLENHSKFCDAAVISTHLAYIEQNAIIENINGLLFGHYTEKEGIENEYLEKCLERFGKRNKIPVIKCDDFGHGINHGIIPIGQEARLDTENKILEYT
jgi:muramoyltetrapeptide carboxypeptidase